jgi:hypothetical protein
VSASPSSPVTGSASIASGHRLTNDQAERIAARVEWRTASRRWSPASPEAASVAFRGDPVREAMDRSGPLPRNAGRVPADVEAALRRLLARAKALRKGD